MSEESRLLRLLVQGDKEAKVSAFTVPFDPTEFVSQLSQGYSRRKLKVRDLSDAASGECYYGYSGEITVNDAMPIPSGEIITIPISTDISLYFMSAASGEFGSLRIEEIS